MKQLKSGILLWFFLAVILAIENTAYSIGFIFTQVDYVFITAIILILYGKRYSAFTFIIIASLIRDFLVLPFTGLTLLGQLTALIGVRMLCDTLYKDNYVTKVVILLAGEAMRWVIHAVLVIIFYWKFKIHFIPALIPLNISLSAIAGAIALKIMEFNYTRFRYWLRMTFGKG